MWAGNSGSQPAAGNGTCGTATLSNSLSGASYSNSFVYTHLGQLWQGPLNGTGSQQQYLYCNSQPHELTGLYGSGATCSNKTGQVYASSYDNWGNVTSRTTSGTTATLTYDLLDHFTSWNAGSSNKDLYVYDASGTRVLRRTTNGSGTTMKVYAFGLEEHTYTSSGSHTSDLSYYSLGGRLLGTLDSSSNTVFDLTDALGSVLASFSNVVNSAAIKSNQVFGPYGNPRDVQGSSNTAKGFTGQYNDSLTGLDYYGSRYYDQVAGVFLSADFVQGNGSGVNPYAYVGGNPETRNDPTGAYFAPPGGGNGGAPPSCVQLGDCGNISGSNPFVPYNYPPIVFPRSTSVPPSSLVVPQPKVNFGSSTIVPLSNGHTSCGMPDGSQPLYGNVGVNFALYLSTGGEVGVPGPWCIECGTGGGSNNGGGGGGSDLSTAYASDTGGPVSDSSASSEASNTNDATGGVLYRVLRPDEDPTLGLVAKDPSATEPVWSHVLNGSKRWYESQYISTSRSLAVALEFAARRGGRMAEINESQVIGDIIDISSPEGARAQGLGGKAYSLARHWQEVLIRGFIPPEAINWVSQVSDFMLF